MKIVSIELSRRSDENTINLLNNLLSKGISNPILYDNVIIEINMDLERDDPIKALYRLMYETKYVRNVTSRITGVSKFILGLSVGEALFYINRATPPHLRSLIQESTTNIQDIIACLHTFLIEESDMSAYYISEFCTQVGFGVNEINEITHNDKMMKLLNSLHKTANFKKSDKILPMYPLTPTSFETVDELTGKPMHLNIILSPDRVHDFYEMLYYNLYTNNTIKVVNISKEYTSSNISKTDVIYIVTLYYESFKYIDPLCVDDDCYDVAACETIDFNSYIQRNINLVNEALAAYK